VALLVARNVLLVGVLAALFAAQVAGAATLERRG
jgi:hypothetical protein